MFSFDEIMKEINDKQIEERIKELVDDAIEMRAFYLAMVEGGFSEDESMNLLVKLIGGEM